MNKQIQYSNQHPIPKYFHSNKLKDHPLEEQVDSNKMIPWSIQEIKNYNLMKILSIIRSSTLCSSQLQVQQYWMN